MLPLTIPDLTISGPFIRKLWQRLSGLPCGPRLFNSLLRLANPYSGSLGAEFIQLQSGYAEARLRDRRAIRNHLGSIHALALMNFAELTSGLALLTGLPADAQGIPVHIDIDYHKKARGDVIGECSCDPPESNARQETEVACTIRNMTGDDVASARVRWQIGPR